MKSNFRDCFVPPIVVAALGWMLGGQAAAQTFTTLHSFTHEWDIVHPHGGLALSGNILYGTTRSDRGVNFDPLPPPGRGTVFALNTDGTGFTNLHYFDGLTADPVFSNWYFNYGGAFPQAELILLNNTLYGTASSGGSVRTPDGGAGTLFKVNTNGTGFTVLHNFGSFDGIRPYAGLITNPSGNTLYGTTSSGGSGGNGTVFAVDTDGTGFTNLHSFTTTTFAYYPNSDGVSPTAGLVLSGNTLYGTTAGGGAAAHGTVFAVNTDGTSFRSLYHFTAFSDPNSSNSDGAFPSVFPIEPVIRM